MNKEIEKIQVKLLEAKNERARSETRYNSHIVIVEGTRNTLRELERISHDLLSKLMDSENVVGEFNNQLKKAVEDESMKNEAIEKDRKDNEDNEIKQ